MLDLALGDALLEPLPRVLPLDPRGLPDETVLLVPLLDRGLLGSLSSILLNISLEVVCEGEEIRGGILGTVEPTVTALCMC